MRVVVSMDHDSGMHGTSDAVLPARESKTWDANNICEVPGGGVETTLVQHMYDAEEACMMS